MKEAGEEEVGEEEVGEDEVGLEEVAAFQDLAALLDPEDEPAEELGEVRIDPEADAYENPWEPYF